MALGYPIPKRLFTFSLVVSKNNKLKIARDRLAKRGLYEIVANTSHYSSISGDEKNRKTVQTQRHSLRKRLVKPYKDN